MVRMSSAVVLAVAVLAMAAATEATLTACSLYTTCADCACNRLKYKVDEECKSGCEWQLSTKTCVLNGTATGPAYSSLWKVPDIEQAMQDAGMTSSIMQEQRLRMVEDGNATCEISRGAGTVATVIIMMLVAGLFQVTMLVGYLRRRRATAQHELGARQWLLDTLRSHVPEGENIVWEGATERPGTKDEMTFGNYLILAAFSFLPLTVPTFVWLGIGLPYSIETNWEFDFYYPICFVGGLGFLGSGAVALSSCGSSKAMSKAYAITNNHAIIVTGDAHKRAMTGIGAGVKSININAIVSVERMGNSVKFEATQTSDGRAGHKVNVMYANLATADAGTLFALLQRLRPANTPVSALPSEDAPTSSSTNKLADNSKRHSAVSIELTSNFAGAGTGRATNAVGYQPVV